jgi:ligand-binding sensor domain-containing protein
LVCKILYHATQSRRKYLFLPILLLYIFSVDVSGQSSRIKKELTINQLSIEEGLRQSMVKGVLQDCRGLVWMTTGDGLHMYDGNRFSVFKVPADSLFSPFDNLMRSFAEVKPNKFAIAAKTALLYFDSEKGNFKTIIRINDSKIFKLQPQNTTIVWEHNLGFALLNDTTLHPISLDILGKGTPLLFTPTRMCSHKGKTMLIGAEGLIEIEGIPSTSTKKLKAKYYNLNFSDMLVDSKGELLLLEDCAIHKYLGRGKTEIYFNTNQKGMNLFFEDKHCNLWLVNNSKKSLHILKDSVITPVNLIAKQGRLKEEVNPYILNFFEDLEGSFWFGTDGHGVLQLQTNLLQFLRADIGFVRSICSSNKSVYVGTFQNGIHKLSPDLENIERIDFKDLNLTNELLDIEIDCKKRLWVATANQVFVTNQGGNVVYKKEIKTLRGNLLKLENGIIQYYTDSCFYEFSSRSNPKFLSQRKYMYITSSISIYGKRWVGTPFGLFAIDKWDENSTYHYPTDYMLTSHPINAIRSSHNGIWVASSHGLMLFDSTSKRIELPTELSILKSENIYSLEIDNKNRLWISTNSGIGCILAELDRIIWFDAKNNLQSLEFNSKASLWANNMLYFGGINGINAINPNSFKPKPNMGKPLLVQLIIADSSITNGIPSNKLKLTLRWDKSSIRGKVASASYIATIINATHFI